MALVGCACLVPVPANGTRALWRAHDIDGRGSRAGGVKETKGCVCMYCTVASTNRSISHADATTKKPPMPPNRSWALKQLPTVLSERRALMDIVEGTDAEVQSSMVLTNLNIYSFSKVRDRGIRFDASAIFFSFFQGIFGQLRKRRVFPDKTFNTYLPLKLLITTVNHAVNDSILLK